MTFTVSKFSPFMDFITKYWKTILGVLLFFFLVFPYLKRMLEAQKLKTQIAAADNDAVSSAIININPANSTTTANSITTRKDIQAAATAIADAFRTKFSLKWYQYINPYNWFEKTGQAMLYLKYQRHNFHIVELLYYNVETPHRNLKSDCIKFLNSEQIAYCYANVF